MTQFLFCGSYMHMYFLLTRAVGTLQKTNLTITISLRDTHTFHQHCLPLPHWGIRKDWKETNVFSVGRWLIQGRNTRKKGYDRVPQSFVFLRMPLPSLCVQSKFWFQWKAWPFRAISTPTYSAVGIAHLVLTCLVSLSSSTLWVYQSSVLLGHRERYMWMGRQGTAVLHIVSSLAHMHAPLSHQLHYKAWVQR